MRPKVVGSVIRLALIAIVILYIANMISGPIAKATVILIIGIACTLLVRFIFFWMVRD